VQRHLGGVFDVEKISALFAVPILASGTLEQLYRAGLLNLVECLVHEAAHLALVLLVWTEHIEVFQTCDAVEPALIARV